LLRGQTIRGLSNTLPAELHDVGFSRFDFLEVFAAVTILLHETPRKSCKIMYKEYCTFFMFYPINNLQSKHGKDLLYCMFWPKMSTWFCHMTVSGLTVQHQTDTSINRIGPEGFICSHSTAGIRH
jgi:hypothetical protein